MTVAIVLAGGIGSRVGETIPKQFLEVENKPILIYTLESFQQYQEVDAIEVVCIDGWQDRVWEYAECFRIDKLQWVVTGGESVQESIRNGVFFLEEKLEKEDIVIIHDGIRPIMEQRVLIDTIEVCKLYGNGVSALPYHEQIFITEDGNSTRKYIPRESLMRVMTPQAYRFGKLDEKYHEAFEKQIGIFGSSYTNTMMVELGEKLYFAKGSEKNMKLTTKEDIELFKTFLRMAQGNGKG